MGSIKNTLGNLNVRPSKNKGQNFLSSRSDAALLVKEANIKKGEIVIEIGPGLGSMTEILLELGFPVLAIEIERAFIPFLIEKFSSYSDNLHIIKSDFRDVVPSLDLIFPKFRDELSPSAKFRVVSNVPYVLSTEVVIWMIRHRKMLSGASLLVQKEFAERLNARPNTKAYGSLSVLVQLFSKTRLGVQLSGEQFHPKAEVESQQIHFEFPGDYENEVEDQAAFENLVRSSFAMRRKMLLNNLMAAGLILSKEAGAQLLESLSLSAKVRAEDLSVRQYIDLYRLLCLN